MTGGVATVTPEADLSEVIDLMLTERIGAVPVVDDAENVCGIISYVDVLRTIEGAEAPAGRTGSSRMGAGAAGSPAQR
jgi:CBS domain-containing protein